MKSLKKCAALLTTAVFAGSMATSCGNTRYGLVVDDSEVKAGVFIYYTISAYYDAVQTIGADGTDTSNSKNVKNAMIDGVSSTEWIQNKATESCVDYVAVNKEFDKLNQQLTDEEKESVDSTVSYFIEANGDIFEKNGISEASVREVVEYEYKWRHVFDYYYGFEGEKGMSEDDLKQYYQDNNARVKYLEISLKDDEGNILKGSDKTERVKMANDYAKRINAKSSTLDKLFEMNAVKEDYDEYIEEYEAKAAEARGETTLPVETTAPVTTSEGEVTTTTTTGKYDNEVIIQRATTTATTTTTAVVEGTGVADTSASSVDDGFYQPSKETNEFIFSDKAKIGVAEVIEEAETVYVILKADITERMNEDDLWTESKIESLQLENFEKDFGEFLDSITNSYKVKKNKNSYKRYSPFKLKLDDVK